MTIQSRYVQGPLVLELDTVIDDWYTIKILEPPTVQQDAIWQTPSWCVEGFGKNMMSAARAIRQRGSSHTTLIAVDVVGDLVRIYSPGFGRGSVVVHLQVAEDLATQIEQRVKGCKDGV